MRHASWASGVQSDGPARRDPSISLIGPGMELAWPSPRSRACLPCTEAGRSGRAGKPGRSEDPARDFAARIPDPGGIGAWHRSVDLWPSVGRAGSRAGVGSLPSLRAGLTPTEAGETFIAAATEIERRMTRLTETIERAAVVADFGPVMKDTSSSVAGARCATPRITRSDSFGATVAPVNSAMSASVKGAGTG